MASKSEQLKIDLTYNLPFYQRLVGKVAIISGGTRGIGRACALKLAKLGCNIVIAAKTVKEQPTLPGTIYSVAEECRNLGVEAIGVQIDMRNIDSLKRCVDETVERFGRIDILINNASALWWQDIVDTPVSKFDLILSVNARGTFFLTQYCLPVMEKHNFGRVITMSPEIKLSGYGGFTAYNISKFGMTMAALGVHEEYFLKGKNISGNSLWPATVIESSASINFEMGERSLWRKPEVLADACLGLISAGGPGDKSAISGLMLNDEDFLRHLGLTDADFVRYRCVPDCEPPRVLVPEDSTNVVEKLKDLKNGSTGRSHAGFMKRGSVRKLEQDKQKSNL